MGWARDVGLFDGSRSLAGRVCGDAWSVVIPLAAATTFHFWLTSNQPHIEVNGGLGYDGYHYMSMAVAMMKGDDVAVPGPFAYRLLTPYLASLYAESAYQGFVILGIIANFFAVALLHLWLLARLNAPWLATSLTLAFVLMLHGPFRFHYYYPNLTDPLAFLFFVLGCLSLDLPHTSWKTVALMSTLAVVGALVRESLLVIPFAHIFGAWKGRGTGRWKGLLVASVPLALGLATLLLVRHIITTEGNYSSRVEALRFLQSKGLRRYAHAWLLVFGPLLALPLAFPLRALQYLRCTPRHAAYLLAIAALAFVGGNDTERFVVWTIPPMLLLVGILIRGWRLAPVEQLVLGSGLAAAFLVVQRFGSTIPPISPEPSANAAIWLVPQGPGWSYLELKSWDCSRDTSITSFTQLLVVIALLILSLRLAALRAKLRGRPQPAMPSVRLK